MFSIFRIIFNFLSWIWESITRVFRSETAQLRFYKHQMKYATTYEEWEEAALNYDRTVGKEKWKLTVESNAYDFKLIAHRYAELTCARQNSDIPGLILMLRAGLVRGLGGINNSSLHLNCFVSTKKLIEDYIDEVSDDLKLLVKCDNNYFAPVAKTRFFSDMLQAFGNTALCLSGGGSLGLYHFGVVKCLFQAGLLPKIISGASIGALVTALLGVYTDKELPLLFEPEAINFDAFDKLAKGSAKRKIIRFLTRGYLMDIQKLEDFCHANIGDLTFLEAYNRTGRVINIAVASRKSSEVPWLLNYLTTPNVLIWSAALASCAMPGMYSAVDLFAKDHKGLKVRWNPSKHKWTDTSLDNEMPMTRLAELFNVNQFIVSQVNPHVVPFLSSHRRDATVHSAVSYAFSFVKSTILNELKHRIFQASILIPNTFRFFQHMITQKYVGDITIVPDFSFQQLLHFFTNPSEEFCQYAIQEGEKATWPYISQIRTSMKIEMTLSDCVGAIKITGQKRALETGTNAKNKLSTNVPRRSM